VALNKTDGTAIETEWLRLARGGLIKLLERIPKTVAPQVQKQSPESFRMTPLDKRTLVVQNGVSLPQTP
jgi:hypothetical protein